MADPVRRFRTGCLIVLGLSLLPMWTLARHRSPVPVLGPYSLAIWGTWAAVAGASLVILGLWIRPSWWFRLRARWLPWLPPDAGSLASSPHRCSRGRCLAIVLLAVLLASAYGYVRLRHNTAPIGDQWDYLRHAEHVRTVGGPDFWLSVWQGAWREDNRHPLYPWAIHRAADFESAKAFTLVLSSVLMLILLWRIAALFGPCAAATASVLWAANDAWANESSLVGPETLLTFFLGLAWLEVVAMTRPDRHPGDRVAAGPSSSRAQSLRTGLWLGLAYLTKGAAIPFITVFAAWALWWRRMSALLLVFAVFGLVASPLLIRNLRVFGNPIHEYASPLMWADSAAEGIRRINAGAPIGWRTYLAEHRWVDIVDRAVSGVVWEIFVIGRTHGLGPLGDRRVVTGLPIVLLAIAGLAARPQIERSFVAGLALVAVGLFGWYQPIASGDRFVLYLVPIGLAYASIALTVLHAAGSAGTRPGAPERSRVP